MLLAVAAAAVAVALASPAADGAAATPPQHLAGKTPSGGAYAFSVRTRSDGRFCERFRVRADGEESATSNCQSAGGRGMQGLWEMNCRSRDFVAYGTAYPGVARVVMMRADGSRVRARSRERGKRRAFVLVASSGDLPGVMQAVGKRGNVIQTESFEGADELCADAGVPNPLSVSYTF